MSRTKRDNLKRKMAQASAHIASAILAINEVYTEFDEQATALETASGDENNQDVHSEPFVHRQYADALKNVMLALSFDRDAALAFVLSAWGLSETDLNVFV